jgi:hypothetical protein
MEFQLAKDSAVAGLVMARLKRLPLRHHQLLLASILCMPAIHAGIPAMAPHPDLMIIFLYPYRQSHLKTLAEPEAPPPAQQEADHAEEGHEVVI